MKDTRVTFIKEVYEFSSDKWKLRIKEEFKEIDFNDVINTPSISKLKGGWTNRIDGNIWFIDRKCSRGGDVGGYGFDMNGNWVNEKMGYCYDEEIMGSECSDGKILDLLRAEAIRKGYGVGTLIEIDGSRIVLSSNIHGVIFNRLENTLTVGGAVIFDNGTWTTILSSIGVADSSELFGYIPTTDRDDMYSQIIQLNT